MESCKLNQCLPCEGKTSLLNPEEIQKMMKELSNWTLSPDQQWLTSRFTFKNFYKTMAFVNAVAWIAHQSNHHPDLEVGYQYCLVKYSTHSLGGLSANDFICAKAVNQLMTD